MTGFSTFGTATSSATWTVAGNTISTASFPSPFLLGEQLRRHGLANPIPRHPMDRLVEAVGNLAAAMREYKEAWQ